MTVLATKLRRELFAQPGQAVALLLVTALGVLLFVATAASYADLDASYAHSRARLALADLHADTQPVAAADVERVRAQPGVTAALARVQTSVPAHLPQPGKRARPIELRLVSLPDQGEPALDRLLVVEGQLPSAPGEIALEKHVAARFALAPGQRFAVVLGALRRELRVSGVVVSAEYLWVSRSENDVMPTPDTFGVGYLRRGELRGLARALVESEPLAVAGLAGIDIAASDAAGNQLLLEHERGAEGARVTLAVLGDRVIRSTAEDDLPGVRLLRMDLEGLQGMAAFFPLFFLGIAGFISASVLSRLIDTQRRAIGTMLALGVSRAAVLRHFLARAMGLAGLGALVGGVLGVAAAGAMTESYARELGIPFVATRWHLDVAAIGLGFALLMGLGAGLLPAWRASRVLPAEAMRASAPVARGPAVLLRHSRLPMPLRMALRSVLGRPLRSLGTALGVAAALVLVLTTSALIDSMKRLTDMLFHEARRYDLWVDLVAPLDAAEAERTFAALPGVTRVEGALLLPAQLAFRGKTASALAHATAEGATLLRPIDLDGAFHPPPTGGLVLNHALADRVGATRGDRVRVRLLPHGPELALVIADFADATVGNTLHLGRDGLHGEGVGGATAGDGLVTSLALQSRDLEATREALWARTDLARIEDLAELRALVDDVMGLAWAMTGMMLACSVVLASAILFNTATLSVLERRRELATLRALGRTMREIRLTITLENGALALLGLVLGLPLGLLTTRYALDLYSSDLFALPFVVSPATVVVAALGVLAVLFVAQWPALRAVERWPVAEAVRDM
ncbi:MAG: ABC transporter permease [Deltaproteobacteria bacterium]|nr:ABC transporter permease [Deltaproteobacteria bacterium]